MIISKKSNVLILSHGYRETEVGGGPPQDIRDYLAGKARRIDYIVYPFPHANFHYAYLTTYLNGKLSKKIKSPPIVGPEWLQYIQHLFITLYFLFKPPLKFDICFALDDLSVVSVLFLRKLGYIKKLVYYSIDYTAERFSNPALNYLYHLADRIACMNADLVWVVAKHMVDGRKKNGVNIKKCAPFIEVPIGFRSKEIKIQPSDKIDRFRLVFVGILLEKQGLQLAIEALPAIIKKYPKTRLTVIGTGGYEDKLKALVKKYNLGPFVDFLGFVENHRDVEKILTHAGIGLAPYKPLPGSFTYFADPGKIKLYLGCGLPIITTNVPAIAKRLDTKQAGVIIRYSSQDFKKAVFRLFKRESYYITLRQNAIAMSKQYDVDHILEHAIGLIPNN